MPLTMGEKIKVILNRKNLTITDLAKKLGQSRQNMTNKLNRDNFTTKELNQIAEALECEFRGTFVLADGEEI